MVVLTPAHRLLMHTVSTYILQEYCSGLTPSAVENVIITFIKAFVKGAPGSTEDNNSPEGTTGQYILLSLQVCTLKKAVASEFMCIISMGRERSCMLSLSLWRNPR